MVELLDHVIEKVSTPQEELKAPVNIEKKHEPSHKNNRIQRGKCVYFPTMGEWYDSKGNVYRMRTGSGAELAMKKCVYVPANVNKTGKPVVHRESLPVEYRASRFTGSIGARTEKFHGKPPVKTKIYTLRVGDPVAAPAPVRSRTGIRRLLPGGRRH